MKPENGGTVADGGNHAADEEGQKLVVDEDKTIEVGISDDWMNLEEAWKPREII